MRRGRAMRRGLDGQPPRRRAWIGALVVVMVAIVAALDFSTNPEASVAHLYYIPIVVAAVQLGWASALAVGGLAVVLAHFGEPSRAQFRYDEADVIQLILFMTIGLVAAKLAADARMLKRLAHTDDLTGLGNLRAFEAAALSVLGRAARSGASVAIVSLDADRLKQLNDRYGHLSGADAVKAIGAVIARELPKDAYACRYGGDEFAIVIESCDADRARALAQRIRSCVAAVAPVLDNRSFPAGALSVSAGIACIRGTPGSADEAAFIALFRRSDEDLYAAKRARTEAGSDAIDASAPARVAVE